MESARRTLQIVQAAFLGSIAMYALLVKTIPSTVPANLQLFRIITVVAVLDVLVVFVVRRTLVARAQGTLAAQPEDAGALQRWRTGYIVTWAASEAVALFGVVLHFIGFTLTQVAPFLIAGFVLILFSAPRRPATAQ